jgi:hypothetical protein
LVSESPDLYDQIQEGKRMEINPLYHSYKRYNYPRERAAKNFDPKKSPDSDGAFDNIQLPIGWEIRISDEFRLFRPLKRYIQNQTRWDGEQVVAISYPVLKDEQLHCFLGDEKTFIEEYSEQSSHCNPQIKLTGIGETLKNSLEYEILDTTT